MQCQAKQYAKQKNAQKIPRQRGECGFLPFIALLSKGRQHAKGGRDGLFFCSFFHDKHGAAQQP